MEHGEGQTAEAQVDGAFVVVSGAHSGTGLHIVGRADYVMPGMVRMRAKSSQHWWEAPSSPTEMPPWVAPILTFRWG